jgi:Protein of unknown function (DUF1559)
VRHSVPRRRGFTTLQLAVVVFIIAIVIGLLLPAVERVRGAAARMQCCDKLAQLAHAAHNYASTYEDSLPPGSVVGSAKEPADRLGVLVALLPFVEQDKLYESLDRTKGREEQPGTDVALTAYRCPINSRPETAKHANYVAVAGVDPDAATLPLKNKRAGAFGYARVVRLEDIKDGTSNTLLFLETHHETGPWASAAATLRGIDPDDETPVGKGSTFGVDHGDGAWTLWGRSGECNAAMADGSVRKLKALATVAGGEEIPAEW